MMPPFIIYFHTFVRIMALVMSVAAIIGAFFHLLVGLMIGSDLGIVGLIGMGLKNGAWYAGIWSPGLAIVGLFVLGHYRNKKFTKKETSVPQ